MRWHPPGYGGERRDADRVKRDGWRGEAGPWPQWGRVSPPNGVLAISIDDERLSWPERELIRQLGEKLYGPRNREADAPQP
ncbi:hypothetical protein DKT77_12400 [Meridianimarinicoccus roseus]|uniref:Uncharacterized protein n=1 Tax=Meridianimarinicoccus roseus TaxID=2072018 RepID=A0A2V2LB31_9RHOB|nr:hypothetical protein [Meridianimarinicoccus roseus]PWR02412.1 hypothetical protein DKT77_12400 [Meridianimarinicoccus roseus]